MATQTNPLKYTSLDYGSIIQQITDYISSNPKFDNFRESAIAQTLLEMFAGVTDINNYYIERQAAESFFETLQKKSSAILLSRNLAYDITRPIPAETTISITLKGDFRGIISQGTKLQFPVYQSFSYNNHNFILKNGFTYTFTSTDLNNINSQGVNYSNTLSVDDNGNSIVLIQGLIKQFIIQGVNNPQVGQIFQKYKIPDTTFANTYGNSDYTDFPTTKIWVGKDQSDNNEYLIDRRSLINDNTIQGIINDDAVKCCVIRTSTDESVELMFGTARTNSSFSLGGLGAAVNTGSPATTFDNIWIQYLSTEGSVANTTGVIGQSLINSNSILLNNGSFNITNKVTFQFLSNIYGGGDLEDIESIKNNAPAIFYTLDRIVSKSDYITYLKTLTAPIKVKNALAWGEQEEANLRNVSAIIQLFNVILFSCVGSLYNLDGDIDTSTYTVKTVGNGLESAILDIIPTSGAINYDEDAYPSQYYFNIYVKNNVAEQLKDYTNPRIITVLNDLGKRGQITIKHVYVSPILQNINLVGNVYVNQLSDKSDIGRQINNAVYKFLDEQADYNIPIYRSNLVEVIESFPGINHSDIKFEPKIELPLFSTSEPDRVSFFYPVLGQYPAIDNYVNILDVDAVYGIIFEKLRSFFNINFVSLNFAEPAYRAFISYIRTLSPDKIQLYTKSSSPNIGHPERYDYTDKHSSYTNLNITNERIYLTEIIKDIYDNLYPYSIFRDSDGFQSVISDIHKDLTWLIRQNMIDSNGNVAAEYKFTPNQFGVNNKTLLRGGYSIGSEIAKIDLSKLNYTY